MTGPKDRPVPLPANAAEWVIRMRSGEFSGGERKALEEWLGASADNPRELLRAEAAWRLSGSLASEARVRQEIDSLAQETGAADPVPQPASPRRKSFFYAVAATVLLAVLAGITWRMAHDGDVETARGEQRMLTLDDGSIVTLNTDTELDIDFSAHTRQISLRRGEALFQVARDPSRPFIVRAGAGYARALGTRFNVVADQDNVTVSVLEGRVEVAPQLASREESTVLGAGESTAYMSTGKLTRPEPTRASPERIDAWREGKLRFDSWTLARAVSEDNRYAEKPLRLGSEEFANVPISGVFRIGDSSAFVQAIGELLGTRVVDEGDTLLLTRK